MRALRPAQVLSLQDTDVEKLGLVGVDLQRCPFAGALNLDKLSLSGPITFSAAGPRLPDLVELACHVAMEPPRGHSRGIPLAAELPRLMPQSAEERRMSRCKAFLLSYHGARFKYRDYWRDCRRAARPSSSLTSRLITGEHLASLYRALRKTREDVKDEPGAHLDRQREAIPPACAWHTWPSGQVV